MAVPRVLLAHHPGIDLFPSADLDRLEEVAVILDRTAVGRWDDPRTDALLADTEVILGHWGCPAVDASVLDRAPRLGLLAYAAGTVKDVVTGAVFDRGIRITSGSIANAEPVAEYTLAMILLAGKEVLWRRDRERDETLRARTVRPDVPVGNWDKTIGIVGASAVGRRVIELLRPFAHLAVTLYDPYVRPDEAAALGVTKLGLRELCATADVLSIHAPALPETHHLIAAAELAALRTGTTLINTARGSLVDHAALELELAAGRLYAVLDVTEPEPLPRDSVLRSLPNVFHTPHLAGSEGTELRRLSAYALDEIGRWARGEPARNEVTRAALARLA